MTKKIIIICSVIVLLISCLVLGRLFNFYTFYVIPTSSMEPTYRVNQNIFASSLFSPKKGDVVAYESTPMAWENPNDNFTFLCRFVADENDTVEVKNGFLYVNNKLDDDTSKLYYSFKVDFNKIKPYLNPYQLKYNVFPFSEDSSLFYASYEELNKQKINQYCTRFLSDAKNIDPALFNVHAANFWSFGNFGPVVVPNGHCFLMGDNRDNSADSRCRGFVNKDKIIAKAF